VLGALYYIFLEKRGYLRRHPRGRVVLEDCDITQTRAPENSRFMGPTANPVIAATRIHDGRFNGVWAYNGGQKLLETCDISRTRMAGRADRRRSKSTLASAAKSAPQQECGPS